MNAGADDVIEIDGWSRVAVAQSVVEATCVCLELTDFLLPVYDWMAEMIAKRKRKRENNNIIHRNFDRIEVELLEQAVTPAIESHNNNNNQRRKTLRKRKVISTTQLEKAKTSDDARPTTLNKTKNKQAKTLRPAKLSKKALLSLEQENDEFLL